jgi:hypothetical protein
MVETARELCGCAPVVVDMVDVRVVPMFEDWVDGEATAVLNATLVGLLCGARAAPIDELKARKASHFCQSPVQVVAWTTPATGAATWIGAHSAQLICYRWRDPVIDTQQSAMSLVCVQDSMACDPPMSAGLALVHCVDTFAGKGGVMYLHTPASLERLEKVSAVCACNLEVPNRMCAADGLTSPYLRLFCTTTDASAGAVMKSRRNLVRLGQL